MKPAPPVTRIFMLPLAYHARGGRAGKRVVPGARDALVYAREPGLGDTCRPTKRAPARADARFSVHTRAARASGMGRGTVGRLGRWRKSHSRPLWWSDPARSPPSSA